MKKIVALTLATSVAAGLFLSGCAMNETSSTSGSTGSNTSSGQREVNVCSWGEYIDTDLITQFEEETTIPLPPMRSSTPSFRPAASTTMSSSPLTI